MGPVGVQNKYMSDNNKFNIRFEWSFTINNNMIHACAYKLQYRIIIISIIWIHRTSVSRDILYVGILIEIALLLLLTYLYLIITLVFGRFPFSTIKMPSKQT